MVKHLKGNEFIPEFHKDLYNVPFFKIYINDLPDGITSMCKIFADDTSFISKFLDVNKTVIELNTDLEKIN